MSQTKVLFDLLKDQQPHRSDEILANVYGGSHLGLARIASRIYDLKKQGHIVKGWKDPKQPSLYWYQLQQSGEPVKALKSKNPSLDCCPSYTIFKIHATDCITHKQIINSLF